MMPARRASNDVAAMGSSRLAAITTDSEIGGWRHSPYAVFVCAAGPKMVLEKSGNQGAINGGRLIVRLP